MSKPCYTIEALDRFVRNALKGYGDVVITKTGDSVHASVALGKISKRVDADQERRFVREFTDAVRAVAAVVQDARETTREHTLLGFDCFPLQRKGNIATAHRIIELRLQVCAREVVSMSNTGVLGDGFVREAIRLYDTSAGTQSVRAVTSYVEHECLVRIAENIR